MSSAFKLPVDIANRACQRLGSLRILTTDFSEDSQQAAEMGACYDACRESELRRNLWTFATKRDVLRPVDLATQLWTPPAYAAGTTYALGEITTDTAGEWWQSKVGSNVGNAQTQGSAYWAHYAGSDAPTLYDTLLETQYFAGELVILPATYAGGTTYAKYAVVKFANATYYDTYVSLQASNTGHSPDTSTTYWQLYADWKATNPAPTNPLSIPGGAVYMALASGIGDTTGTVPAVGNWLAVNGTFSSLQIIYPIGSGPSIDTATANVYRLPHGFLRRAPVAPRASVNTYLGAPHLMFRDDAVEENGYLVSSFVGPRMLRYVRDFVDVQDMDVMFCEGLSARMALETVDRITGSNADRQEQHAAYKLAMGEARTANAIEQGAVDIPEDEFISCRI